MEFCQQLLPHDRRIVVIGLGYVGLPVAVAFGRSGAVTLGFDIDPRRIAELMAGLDRTQEVKAEDLSSGSVVFTADASDLRSGDFFIVTVPTPIDAARRPDLSMLRHASRLAGAALRPGGVVVYESTVYPGATEEVCIPLLEHESGLTCGRDFTVGYSPERINPGDRTHRFEAITKVIAATDEQTLDLLAAVYGSVVPAGVFRASSIKVAEASKVIENAQRDLNIAFMNELSKIFRVLNIDTQDVLKAAATKWNFLPFEPGLVGGHCIGVDPYYLTHRAEIAGYQPDVILAGRRINDAAGIWIAQECKRLLMQHGIRRGLVTILGLSFKENVPDVRNTGTVVVARALEELGVHVQVVDPVADAEAALALHHIRLMPVDCASPADVVLLAVPHRPFLDEGWGGVGRYLKNGAGIVMDIKARLDRALTPPGITLWRP